MAAEDNKALIRRLYDAANARDYDTLRQGCTPEFGEWLARAVRSGWEQFDGPWEILDVLADGDKVAVHWKREGTNKDDYHGVPAAGQRMSQEGVRIWRFEGSKLAETYGTANHIAILRQLGVLLPAKEGRSATG